jgi:ureidoglycolate amidohydrolase
MRVQINVERLMGELDHLASITDCPAVVDPALPEPQRAVTRVVFTERDLEARAWFKHLATEAGFTLREDAVGNTFVRWEGAEPDLAAIGTGSHIDAIPYAGMYDGTVGVLGGLEAMRALKEAGFRPRRSLELILFTSEEPTRFGIGCLGSRLMSGVLSPEVADALPDRLRETDANAPAGGTLRSVREAAGFRGPLESVRLPQGFYGGWVELHIEQGPLLERRGEDIGIVTHIAGPASYRITVEGVGGHAGALLMPDRRDALCAAAELVLALEHETLAENAKGIGDSLVATVGKMDVYPGAVNAVPSRVIFTVDIRDIHEFPREEAMQRLRATAQAVSQRRGVTIREERINADAPATCDGEIIRTLVGVANAAGARLALSISRAYHDTSFMARIAPVSMLFIPCRNGVSHRPDEYASPEAIRLGVEVLAGALAELSLA